MTAISTRRLGLPSICLALCAATGCFTPSGTYPREFVNEEPHADRPKLFNKDKDRIPYDGPLPRELDMVSLPEYVVEPPDILRVDAIRVIPPSPYKVEPLDGLFIQVTNVPMEEPINGIYVVDPDGTITLGPSYGPPIRVLGLTLTKVKELIEEQLKKVKILNPKASVALGQSRALQQIRGEHLVRLDGTIGLGTYGSVRVVGLTLTQAKAAIQTHLSQFVQQPEIAVDVAAYNSKTYFVIYDGAGNGQQVIQMPITGNDTVLKAIAQLNGLPPLSSKFHLWIARPAPCETGQQLVMPVDWIGIVTKGQTKTNYQMLPGDRLYISGNRLIAANTYLAQVLAPIERMLGITLLGTTTVQATQGRTGGGGTP